MFSFNESHGGSLPGGGMPEPEPPPKKKPRLAPGKFARRSGLLHRACSMRQGPTSLEQLMNWPQRLCQDIWDGSSGELRRARTAANIAAGLVLAGEYSGELCAETAIRMQVMGMASNGLTIPLDRIISYSACEINLMCRRLILQSRHPPLHLFPSVLNFVKPSDGEELFKRGPPKYEAKGGTPAEDARRLEEAMAAFQEQSDYLSSHSKTIFTSNARQNVSYTARSAPSFGRRPLMPQLCRRKIGQSHGIGQVPSVNLGQQWEVRKSLPTQRRKFGTSGWPTPHVVPTTWSPSKTPT